MSNWATRKKERREYYNKYVKGWKEVKCNACNGSGYYDHDESPDCDCCEGTGKEKISPEKYNELEGK